jgi:hypothetical protein
MASDRSNKPLWMCAVCAGIALLSQGVPVNAQRTADAQSACILQKDLYQCDWLAFKQTFVTARTVSVQAEPMDVHSNLELKKLVQQLGKSVIDRGPQPADLTMLLVPLNKDGIYIGPGDENLGTLRIYTGRTKTEPGTLVWAETYRGPKDIPWSSVEFYLMRQFEARLKGQNA